SPQWQTTNASGWRAFDASATPVATGTVTPRRPDPIGVPPATHETCPAISRLRRNFSMTRARGRKPRDRGAPRAVVSYARMPVLDGEVTRLIIDDTQRHEERSNELESTAEVIDVVHL